VQDKKLGELVAAVVVVRQGQQATEQEIIDHAKKLLPRHSVPVMIMLQKEKDENQEARIQRSPNGKVVKKDLKIIVEKEYQRRTKAKL